MRFKYKLYRVVVVFMAMVLFCTSATYTIDRHYCKGELKSLSFFGKAKPCYKQEISCPHHAGKGALLAHTGCCKNETIVVSNLDTDYPIPSLFPISSISDFVMLPASEAPNQSMLDMVRFIPTRYMNYRPPLPREDLGILYQQFLI